MTDDRSAAAVEAVAEGRLRITHVDGWCTGREPEAAEFGVALFVGNDYLGTVGPEAAHVRLISSDGAVQECELEPIPGTSAKSFHAVIVRPAAPIAAVAIGADGEEVFRKDRPIID
jgi:hypothetical protein